MDRRIKTTPAAPMAAPTAVTMEVRATNRSASQSARSGIRPPLGAPGWITLGQSTSAGLVDHSLGALTIRQLARRVPQVEFAQVAVKVLAAHTVVGAVQR